MRDSFTNQKAIGLLSIFLIIAGILIGLGLVVLPIKLWVGLVVSILVLFLALYNPTWIIILLLFVCPFGRLWEVEGITLYELGYSLIFLLILTVSFGRRFLDAIFTDSTKDFSSPLTYPLLTLLLISLVSTIIAHLKGIPFAAWTSDLNLVLFYGFYFVTFYNCKTEKTIVTIFSSILIAVCLSLAFVRVPVERFATVVPRLGEVAASPYALAVFFPTLCTLLFSKNRGKKIIFILISLLLLIGIISSFGRSRWLGLIGGMFFLFLFLPPFNKSRLLKYIFVLLVSIMIYILFCVAFPFEHYLTKIPLLIWERLGSIIRVHTEPPIVTRISETVAVFGKIRQHPFVGNGLGAAVTFMRYDLAQPVRETSRYIHNSYLFFLFKIGIFGLLAFLWLCTQAIIYSIKTALSLSDGIYKAFLLGFASSFVAVLITSIAAPDATSPIFSIYIGFIFGATTVIDKNAKKIKQS